jgi:hypothetical protein
MKKIILIFAVVFSACLTFSCQTVNKKIDEKTLKEQEELTKWLNKSELELKVAFGNPDKIDFSSNGNRYYVYVKEKLKIKCVRKFEINPKNMVMGFSSKNCF